MPAPSFHLRPAELADLPLLAPIEQAADRRYQEHGYPPTPEGDCIPEDAATRAIAQQRITVAVLEERVVGWILVTLVGAEMCICQVSVLPECGRLGVGTALLLDSLERARAQGVPSVMLNTERDVPWTVPWYQRHGFEIVPPEEWSDELRAITEAQRTAGLDWNTRVHMRKRLV